MSDLRHHFGGREISIELTGATVKDLLDYLKRTYGYDFLAEEHTMLFLNGKGGIRDLEELHEGDHVALVPIMAAG
ncbi:MAG: MoaD/ThiS family protein [Candidatus Aureabacteria bacterium]|nr:MoaD/ThiS family protein [Candidatus Auribacterota bacterium]